MSDARRLWDKGDPIDEVMHRFTVGDDPRLDLNLIHWDCLGSAAHVRTIERLGLLSPNEANALVDGLREIDRLSAAGEFAIPPELEDGHTAIEAHLTRRLGPVGEKLHAGRSRNDQVATAMRLWLRRTLLDRLSLLLDFGEVLLQRIERDGAAGMPGYTHLRRAMPSSVGQWLHAFVEATLENAQAGLSLLDRIDQCPLGTGAGFGVTLALDRAFSARALGFSRVQRSPVDVQNSRGRYELLLARLASDIGASLEKLACDLMLYSTSEFGFIELPASLTTGSSLMPQKRNPDALELLRGRAGRLRGRVVELEWITAKLGSNYHRDLQLTKAPVMAAAAEVADMLIVAGRCIEGMRLNEPRMRAAMSAELYATQAALERVLRGVPFRQAYREVACELNEGAFRPPAGATASEDAHTLAALLPTLRGELGELRRQVEQRSTQALSAENTLL